MSYIFLEDKHFLNTKPRFNDTYVQSRTVLRWGNGPWEGFKVSCGPLVSLCSLAPSLCICLFMGIMSPHSLKIDSRKNKERREETSEQSPCMTLRCFVTTSHWLRVAHIEHDVWASGNFNTRKTKAEGLDGGVTRGRPNSREFCLSPPWTPA